jgi:succinylglutamate desuccinylase
MHGDTQIETHNYKGESIGLKLVIFGRIHGPEHCGETAIRRLTEELNSGKIKLTKGELKLFPRCNPRATREKKRYSEKNLNRVFYKQSNPTSYEENLAQEIIQKMGDFDFLLDIHSTTRESPPFAMRDVINSVSDRVLKKIPAEFLLSDWKKLYEGNTAAMGFDTIGYAESVGKTGVCIECGQHDAPNAAELAYEAILITLWELGMIAGNANERKIKAKTLSFSKVVFKEEGGNFTADWKNFDVFEAGKTIAIRGTGEKLLATERSYIVFPRPDAAAGDEWFYLAREAPAF